MAIIQISKIQQRSGNLVDLPQLDQGEFGWASDYGKLYIGKAATGANIENVEVLTSYSNISFSQIDGSEGNLDITAGTLENGQVLTYDGTDWVNRGGTVGGLINLGNVSNVRLSGGGIGYVLETDGTGNLNWTPKGTLYTTIRGLSNANPIVMTVANTTPYTNKQSITITGANATNANSIVNGQTLYVKLAVDFSTSGNVTLYSDNGLTVPVNGTTLGSYTANSGVATAVLASGSSGSNAGGVTGTIQFNNGGVLDGSANLTFNGTLLSLTGNSNVTGNVNVSGVVTSSRYISNVATGTEPITVTSTTEVANLFVYRANIAGTVTTAAQPNITSVGTLTTLSVSGNANVGNIGATNIVGTLSTAAQPNITSVGTLTSLSVSGNANIGNIGTAGLITATGNIRGGNLITTGTLSVTGNANVGNLGATLLIGTLVTASQPNITSTGTLATLSVSGNANVGNLGTAGLITATGNINAGNLITGGTLSVTGNANVGNIGTAGLITATGNLNAGNLITGGVVSATGNLNAGNIITAGIVSATGNGTFGNVSATTFTGTLSGAATSATTAGTVTTAAQPNITSVSTSFTNLTFANAQTISGNNMTLTTGANTNTGTITGNWSLSSGSRLQATYADLAEYYEADAIYEPGTVLEFGGEKEVTIASDATNRVAGVVSSNPAYVMNSQCQGMAVAIALQGRVPVKVRGKIHKGDMMVSGGNGFARPTTTPFIGTVIGKSLENFDGIEGVIEIAIGRL